MPRRLRIGWPRQYTALMGTGSYALTGQDATLTYTQASDTTPDAWSFVDQTGAAVSTVVTSAAVTITGITTPITLNASGGTIDKNGDANFLGSQIVSNGDTVRARVTTSGATSTATSCTVVASPSGVQDTFTVTTVASTSFDYWISASGSDSNPGTQAQPWAWTALFTKAATYAGKRLGVLDGTYDMSGASGSYANTGDQGYCINIPATASGTSGTHTVIAAVNRLGAVFKAFNGSTYFNSTGPGAPSMWEVRAQYVEIDGFEFTASAGHGVTVAVSNVEIRYCWIHDHNNNRHTTQADTNMGGIYFRGSSPAKSNLWFHHNKIHDIIGKTGDPNGIGDLFGVNGVTLEYNTIFNVATAHYWKVNAFNVVVRYCHFYNCNLLCESWSTGQTSGTGTNEIYGNILHGNCFGNKQSSNNNGNAAIVANVYSNTFIFRPSTNWSSSYYGADAMSNPGNVGGYITINGGGTGVVNFRDNAVLLDPTLTVTAMIAIFSTSQASASRISTWDRNRYSRFGVNDATTTNHDASTLVTWQGFGYDLNSPVVGSLGLVDETDASVIANMAPAGGSALLGAGTGGINLGHTGLGITPGCGF
jgi:hypothetical protein